MTSNLQKPDLSKDTTGPFVTRNGEPAAYIHLPFGTGCTKQRHKIQLPNGALITVSDDGRWGFGDADSALDIFLAPKEPKTVFVNWYSFGKGNYQFDTVEQAKFKAGTDRHATLQLEVDDQGVPLDGSVVKRVAL